MTENLLLHVCCGPCAIYPAEMLRGEKINFSAYFFNPNIHPFREFIERKKTLTEFCHRESIPLILHEEYGLQDFLRKVVFHEQDRCLICYNFRLESTVAFAALHGFTAFSTTLLYSKYQNHQAIMHIATQLSEKYHITFLYRDFREGWQQGINQSKEQQMYRQAYCGCIFSEQERYDKAFKR
jgi:epoxyqueuosine reductase